MKHGLCIIALLIALFPTRASPNEDTGAWSDVFNFPVTAIHMSLLHTGHIILWSVEGDTAGRGEPYLLDYTHGCDPQTETCNCFEDDACFTIKPNPANIFCGGHAQLSNGSLLVNGGHVADDIGLADTFLFEYNRETDDWNWTEQGALPDSHFARWYSTLTTLPDGRVLNMSGSEKRCALASEIPGQLCVEHADCGAEEAELCDVQLVAPPEVFDPATREWTLIEDDSIEPVQYYPFNFVAPDGRVFFSGADVGAETIYVPSQESHYFDVNTGSFVPTGQPSTLDGGSAVMFRPGQILKCGGTINPEDPSDGTSLAISTAQVINLNLSDEWDDTGDMNIPRRRHNLTLLPDGTVLATGGTRFSNREFSVDATCGGAMDGTACVWNSHCEDEGLTCDLVLGGDQQWVSEAEIWDPEDGDGVWTLMAGAASPKLYHSSALLLPDGRVLSAGGGPRGFGRAIATYTDAQLYSPPYLFRDSPRPVIQEAPEIIYYGESFEVLSELAYDVDEINLIRLGAVTHSFDQNTRFVPLDFLNPLDGRLAVDAPDNANIAPPGYYMLFLVSSAGVPSVARFVRILEPDPGRDMLFEYSAKVVCGLQEAGSGPQQRSAGQYSTSVNIHNPRRQPVRFFKKLALTSPPGMQLPGRILPIGEDVLEYDEALQTDCRELRQKLISTDEAEVIEGFLVIQSPTALDVTSVYTTAALGLSNTPGGHSSIDVEEVSVRRRAASDLLITKTNIPCDEPEQLSGQFEAGPCDLIYTSGDSSIGYHFRLFEIDVVNLGPDPASGLEVADELRIEFDEQTAIGATLIWGDGPIELPAGSDFMVSQPDITRSRADITLPDLPPGATHSMRFWTVSVRINQSDDPITLINEAEVATTTIDANPLNNTASETLSLVP